MIFGQWKYLILSRWEWLYSRSRSSSRLFNNGFYSRGNMKSNSTRSCKLVYRSEYGFGKYLSCGKFHLRNSCVFHHHNCFNCGKVDTSIRSVEIVFVLPLLTINPVVRTSFGWVFLVTICRYPQLRRWCLYSQAIICLACFISWLFCWHMWYGVYCFIKEYGNL